VRQKRAYVIAATIAIILVMTMCSCTTRMIDFTVLSSKNTEMTVPDAAKGERVKGMDSVPVIFIPIGMPSIKEAVDRAIEKAGPGYDALIDGVVYYKNVSFIFGTVQYTVEGTPIKSQQINVSQGAGSAENLASSKPLLYHSKTGKSNDEAVQQLGIKHADL
jgi:hypothetical protein